MTKKEIKAQIRAKEKEAREIRDKVVASQDIEEVRSLSETLTKLSNDIDDLKTQLDDLEEVAYFERSAIPENAEYHGADVVRAAYGAAGKSYQFGAAGSDVVNGVDTLALRSNEKFASRLSQADKKPLDLGKYVRGAVTGDWANAVEERAAFTTSTTGVSFRKCFLLM